MDEPGVMLIAIGLCFVLGALGTVAYLAGSWINGKARKKERDEKENRVG
jgi:hypothetical protein